MKSNKIPIRLLLVEDSEEDAFFLVRTLTQERFDVDFKRVETSSEMHRALEEQTWDAVISDYQMPSFDGLTALKIYKDFDLDIPFIVVSGAIGEEMAVTVMKAGAHDYILKHNLARLVPAIERELQETQLRQERREALQELQRSESRYRAIVEDQTEMINRSTLDGTLTFANEAYARLNDSIPSKIIGKKYDLFISETGVKQLSEIRAGLTLKRPVSSNVAKHQKKNGSVIWVQWRERLIFDADDNPIEYQGVGRDITHLRQAENELKGFAANLERRAVQLQVAAEIARDSTSIRELDDLLYRAVNLARDRFGFYHVAVFLVDEAGEYALLKAASGEAGRKMIAMAHQLKVGEVGIVGNVASVGEPHIALDVDSDSVHHVQPLLPETRSEMALPLKVGESIIGVLDVQSEKEGAFEDDDVQIIQTMADQLAIAIDNLHLLGEVQHRANELESLYKATLVTSSELEINALLTRLYEQVQHFIHLDSFIVALYEEERKTIYIALAIEAGETIEAFQGIRAPYEGGGVSSYVIKTRKSLLLNDIEADDLPTEQVRDPNEDRPTHAWLGVPLVVRDQILGVVSVQSYQVGAFDKSHQRFLESLASQFAITLENARLFEAERSAREQAETLREIARVISGSIELDQILNLILEQIKRVLVFDSASVLLFDEQNETALVAGLGFEDEKSTSETARILLKDSPILQTMSESLQSIIIPDVSQYPDWIWVSGAEHVRSFLGVPIITRQKMIGAFMVDQVIENAFTEDDALTVQAIAQHMAIAIETVRLFEAERFQLLLARTLQEVGMLLTSELGLAEVLERILDLLGRVVEFDSGSVQLVEKNQQQLYFAAGRGYEDFEATDRVVRELSDHNLTRLKENHNEVIIITDTVVDDDWLILPEVAHIRSWIGAPLIVRNNLIGLLTIDNNHAEAFSADMATTVMTFASQAAIAIENAQLFEAEKSARERAEALREAVQVISSTLSLNQVIEVVLEQLASVLPYDSGSVILVEEDRAYVQAGYGYDELPAVAFISEIEFDFNVGSIWHIIQKAQPLMIPDVLVDNRWIHTALTGHVRSWLGVPLLVRDQVAGLINLERRLPVGFSDEEILLAQVFATHTSTSIENARLFETEEKRAQELETLQKVGLSLTASLEPNAVLVALLEGVFKLMPRIWHTNIFLCDQDRLTFGAELWKDESSKLTLLNPNGNSPIMQVALSGEMISISEFPLDHLFEDLDSEEFEGAFIGLPLKIGERVAGVMNIVYADSQIVSPVKLRVLNLLADQAALTIENARLYETAESRAAELEKLRQVSLGLTASLEPDAVLNTILEGIYELMPDVWDAHIFNYDDDKLTFGKALWQDGTSDKLFAEPRSGGLTYTTAQTGEMVVVIDMATHPLFDGVASEKGWSGAIIGLPLKISERVIGVITIAYQEPRNFSQDELRILRLLGDQSVLAIENARLFNQTTMEQRYIALLYDVGRAIAASLDPEQILKEALALTSDALGGKIGAAWLYFPEEKKLRLQAFQNQNENQKLKLANIQNPDLQLGNGIVGWVAQEKKAVNVPDILKDERWVHISYIDDNVLSMIAAPIIERENLLGVLAVQHHQPAAFDDNHLELLKAICQQVSLALSNARRYQDVDRLVSLLASEQYRLEGLIEMLPVGVLLLDDKHNQLVTNSLARDIIRDLVPEYDGFTISQLGEIPISELLVQQTTTLPLEIVLEDPVHKIFEVEAQSIQTETPQWVVTLREVTKEREIQERVQMQERLATVGQLAAGIAHDFNNIMAAIIVYADLLLMDQTLSASSHERLTIIQQQVQRAASLIRQILDFSRRSVMEQNTLDLLPFLKETKKLLNRTLPETISVELFSKDDKYLITADPTRLQQVFMNLAVNARDAMPKGGRLYFELSHLQLIRGEIAPSVEIPPGNWVSIRVKDTGNGIPIEDQSHIFEPFFTTKPIGQGTGLGLAQVYGIVKQHDGYIDMESQVGDGTQFNIYLPALSEPMEEAKPASPSTDVDGDGKTVLLVEDDYATRKALNAMLTMHNYRVLVAENGVEALDHLENSAEDIVLMVSDVVMPQMGGFDLFEKMKGRWPQIEVLFITGHPLDDQNHQILQQGKVHWLQKPFTIQEFNQFLIEMLT